MNRKEYYSEMFHTNVEVETFYINPNKVDRVLITEFFDKVTLPNGREFYFDSLLEDVRDDEPWELNDEEIAIAEKEVVNE